VGQCGSRLPELWIVETPWVIREGLFADKAVGGGSVKALPRSPAGYLEEEKPKRGVTCWRV
jgi:hypothetical protein